MTPFNTLHTALLVYHPLQRLTGYSLKHFFTYLLNTSVCYFRIPHYPTQQNNWCLLEVPYCWTDPYVFSSSAAKSWKSLQKPWNWFLHHLLTNLCLFFGSVKYVLCFIVKSFCVSICFVLCTWRWRFSMGPEHLKKFGMELNEMML